MPEQLDTMGRQPRDKQPDPKKSRKVTCRVDGQLWKRHVKKSAAKASRVAAKKLGDDAPKRVTKGWSA